MADRLDKIVTRGGDKGETSLGDGTRIPKDHPRIGLLGDIDELNSRIGVVLAHDPGIQIRDILISVQHDLFDLGGALCFPGAPLLSEKHVIRLDEAAATLNENLPPLKEFILPGGTPVLAWLHVARTVCRRVERAALSFLKDEEDSSYAIAYLNRLSDFLFIAGRFEAQQHDLPETLWQKHHSISGS